MILKLDDGTYEIPDRLSVEQAARELEKLVDDDELGITEAHEVADAILLVALDDDRVRTAFEAVEKWYA